MRQYGRLCWNCDLNGLDSFIRRMKAQSDCLNFAARKIAELPGPVVELGLGNAELLTIVGPLLIPLVVSGGIIVSNFALSIDSRIKLAEPPGVKPGRYFLYQAN